MHTLEELIQTIESEIKLKGIDNALDLLSPFEKYNGDDWSHYYDMNSTEFQSSVLFENDSFRLLLIYWNGLSKSKKHGHLQGGGLMRVLFGEICETRFHSADQERVIGVSKYSKGDLSYIHDALAFHVVENQLESPAVSLHLYCNGENSTFGRLDEAA